MFQAEYVIAAPDAGKRLDHFLAEQARSFSRSRLQALIKDGHVSVNGAASKPSDKLRTGDRISLTEPPPVPTVTRAEDIPFPILFEDECLIVIDKPAGLVVHPGAGNWEGTLVNGLLHHCTELSGIGGEQRPGIVHRLDKETSGCLVVAKTDAAHRSLVKQFAGRSVTKIYLALAAGRFRRPSGLIETHIARHPVQRQKMAVVDSDRGREARTGWRTLREWELSGGAGIATLVECTLHTGRTHQIRVHLKHLGHPVLGDAVYGKRGSFERQLLHAWQLGFTHPMSGKPLHFRAPIPADFFAAGMPRDAVNDS
ncbi:MAG TPA: RluA family pseudouridine synthase [Chthoniobacteraceae bacterium]|jgi:23S rRNA pseudouridine1911/1915/1917 synthase